nr:ATP-binding protein [Aquisalinus flavus]
MNHAPDGVILCTDDFKIHICNRHSCELTGHAHDLLINQPVDKLVHNISLMLNRTKSGNFTFARQRLTRADGDIRIVDIKGYKGPIGQECHYVLMVQDITEKLHEEQQHSKMASQLEEARRLEAIGALSSGIAHEINTPIQFIGDNIDYLGDAMQLINQSYQRYEKLRAEVWGIEPLRDLVAEIDTFNASVDLPTMIREIRASLDDARAGIRQVRDIVRLMKEFAHPGTGQKDPVNLNELIGNVVTISRNQQKNIATISLQLDETLPQVPCRRSQIQQALLNLVLNAIDAVAETQSGSGEIAIRTCHDDEQVHLFISDTGNGIPPALRERVFDPFFTTKPVGKGTGQGLALAQDYIVTGHQGRLSLVEIEGYATTFRISLPLRAPDMNLSDQEVEHDFVS